MLFFIFSKITIFAKLLKSICAMKINIEERVERARNYFLEGYNCAQAVFLAFGDLTGMDETTAARLVSSFGGGMGRMREVCGAVSGMAFVASFLSPCPTADNAEAKKKIDKLIKEIDKCISLMEG